MQDVTVSSYRAQSTHTEWQRPLSYVHFIMMEKLAQAGEGGRCKPTPFHYIYHHVGTKLQCMLHLSGQI